jgi:LmbE family N-acetylglucosaminyl deacetylase
VSFLDSDDRMLPHNLETLVVLLDAQPKVSVAYGRYYWMNENGQPIGDPDGPTLEGQILPQLVLEETMFIGTALIRRGCVEAIGGFDETVQFQEHWDFYLRLARAGYAYAYTKQPVALVRFHSGSQSQDMEAMLASRIAILDRLFSDPALEATLAGVRHQACYNAHIDFALDYYANDRFEQGAICLNEALQYTPLHSDDLIEASEEMTQYALASEVKDPLRFARDLFEPIRPTAQVRRLRGKVLGEINAELAFRHYQTEESGRVWRHALGAVIHDPSWLRNRGLLRIGLEGLVGPRIVDWIRSRRFPISNDLLDRVSETASIFISPHFDDAVLSCGGTLVHLAARGADVLLVTVFTADVAEGIQLPQLAQELHKEWGENRYPHRMRSLEEREVAEYLNAQYRWLGFLDGMYRYPGMKRWEEQFMSDFEPRTDPCFESVRDALLQVISEYPQATIFVPLGLGHHRDHLIVHQAVEDVKQMTSTANIYYYYEDYPYAAEADLQARLEQLDWLAEAFTIDITNTLKERVHLIKTYASQLGILFDGPDSVYEEVSAYATRVGAKGMPRERFWRARRGGRHNSAGSGWSGR